METQKDILIRAMFEKNERLAARVAKPRGRYLGNADGSRAYMVLKDRTGAPYKVFRDVRYYTP